MDPEEAISISEKENSIEVVESSKKLLAETLNVPVEEITALNRDLPIKPDVVSPGNILAKGYVDIVEGENKNMVCELVVTEGPDKKVTGVHELVHALHYGANKQLADKAFERHLEHRKEYETHDGPAEYEAQSVVQTAMGMEEASRRNLETFSERTGIKPLKLEGLTIEDLKDVIKQRLSHISGAQMLMLANELKGKPVTFDASTSLENFVEYTNLLLAAETSEERDVLRKQISTSIEYGTEYIIDGINAAIDESKIDLNHLKEIFEAAHIPLEGSITTDILLKKAIASMSKEDQLVAVKKYLESGTLQTEMEGGAASYLLPFEKALELTHGQLGDANLQDMERLRVEAIRAINEKQVDTNIKDPTPALTSLINNQMGKADAMTTLATDAIGFFADLPDDEKARANLLGNSEYRRQLMQALLSSENSPLLEAIGESAGNFAFNTEVAKDSVRKSSADIFKRPSDIDISSFVARERSALSLKTSISYSHAAEIEAKYWEFSYKTSLKVQKEHPEWSRAKIDEEVDATIVARAQRVLENKTKDTQTESNLLLEPIAHILTEIATGKPVSYEGGVMGFGAYSAVLSSQNLKNPESSLNQWHDKIRRMLDKVKKERKLDRLVEFFRATNLEEQKKILERYAPADTHQISQESAVSPRSKTQLSVPEPA